MAQQQIAAPSFDNSLRATTAALVALAVWAAMLTIVPIAQAQTFTVLHTFTGQGDGYQPYSTLTMDNAGNLYGTTSEVGHGAGTIFQFKRAGSDWILKTLYSFSGPDGAIPYGGVTFGPDGALYGITAQGGSDNEGTIYRLTPQASLCKSFSCPWNLTTLHSFVGGGDGRLPYLVAPIFGAEGNLYGTTGLGGANGQGAIFQAVDSGGTWTESVIHSMDSFTEGSYPPSSVVADQAGNLYGVVEDSPTGFGAVFELNASTGWTLSILHNFTGDHDGEAPIGSLIVDAAGNLFGTTSTCPSGCDGVVFELSPVGSGWTYTLLYSFTGPNNGGPAGPLTMDPSGNLYGTAVTSGANGYGSVFKLTRTQSGWTYSSLHDFDRSDGAGPYGGVVLDSSGNIYGTAAYGGALGGNCTGPGGVGCGVIFQITP
jgi:uncharacterized repeat protein (TIGR03803 family)